MARCALACCADAYAGTFLLMRGRGTIEDGAGMGVGVDGSVGVAVGVFVGGKTVLVGGVGVSVAVGGTVVAVAVGGTDVSVGTAVAMAGTEVSVGRAVPVSVAVGAVWADVAPGKRNSGTRRVTARRAAMPPFRTCMPAPRSLLVLRWDGDVKSKPTDQLYSPGDRLCRCACIHNA